MIFLAHRGFWLSKDEQNSELAFVRALENGFGIETDIRDYNGKVVISHDIPHNDCVTFEHFIEICSRYRGVLALNVKADGLQKYVNDDILNYVGDAYFFDMSVPDLIGYLKSNLPFLIRLSDVETDSHFLKESKGVWLDNFSSSRLNLEFMENSLKKGKLVTLVSPELHGYDHLSYWQELKDFIELFPKFENNIHLCTDFPQKAKEFFYGK
ncbi:hypothetical protein [Pseudoalteromonas sp.]|uniref:hypothetical protein n=1 Tax=Pseudoalteromonas sp. TaxID=53249 RepID=UPI0035681BCE